MCGNVCVCQMYLEGGGSAALGLLGGRSHDGHSAGLHCDLILQVKRSQLSKDGPTGADRQKKEEGRGEDAGMEGDFIPADFDDHHRRYSRPRRGRLAGGGR